jgi:hypothetical protein
VPGSARAARWCARSESNGARSSLEGCRRGPPGRAHGAWRPDPELNWASRCCKPRPSPEDRVTRAADGNRTRLYVDGNHVRRLADSAAWSGCRESNPGQQRLEGALGYPPHPRKTSSTPSVVVLSPPSESNGLARVQTGSIALMLREASVDNAPRGASRWRESDPRRLHTKEEPDRRTTAWWRARGSNSRRRFAGPVHSRLC